MVIPAIDILNGRCVRLYKGDYHKSTIYNESPLEQAVIFKEMGFKRIHIVDLDGAKEGEPKNIDIIKKIVVNTGLEIEVGGGIRNLATIKDYIDNGVKWVILGSILAKREEILSEAKDYVNRIIGGIDFKDNLFATDGWQNTTNNHPIEFALYLKNRYNLNKFLFTDVSLDGTLKGPNLDFYREVTKYLDNVIASGGVSSDIDIENLISINGISGVVVGKAIYENKIDIKKWV